MKRFLIAILAILVLSTHGHAAITFHRQFSSLTGEVTGSVDNITCADVYGTKASASDGTGRVVTVSGETYDYIFDQSATNATSSPDYIRCKTYTTSGVWILQANIAQKSDCSGIKAGLCLDTDDGKLWVWNGAAVTEVGVGAGDLLADGTIPLTSGWDVGAYEITALKFASDQATGTAPFTVASVTVVANLNADLLDGKSSAAFEDPTSITPVDADEADTDYYIVLVDGPTGSQATETEGDLRYNAQDKIFNPSDTPGFAGTHKTSDEVVLQFKMANKADTESDTEFWGFTGDAPYKFMAHDGGENVVKFAAPINAAKRIIEVDIGAADKTVTTEVGSTDPLHWNGITVLVEKASGDYDLIIPDCSETYPDFSTQIEVCQEWASQTVSVVSANGANLFRLRDSTNLTAGYELDSPGEAQINMCVYLVCKGSVGANAGAWYVFNETGGTDAIDPTWVTGGAAN
jgi:hypothetical protein